MQIGRLFRRHDGDHDVVALLDPRSWATGRDAIGAKRPEGWLDDFVVRRGVRAGMSPRGTRAARAIQILVETQ